MIHLLEYQDSNSGETNLNMSHLGISDSLLLLRCLTSWHMTETIYGSLGSAHATYRSGMRTAEIVRQGVGVLARCSDLQPDDSIEEVRWLTCP